MKSSSVPPKPARPVLDPNLKSRGKRLYEDIKSAYLRSIGTEEQFYTELNQGCTDSYIFVPEQANNPSLIENCEILEVAYKYPILHPYLAKHKYPLPIGMNDHDSETIVDDKLREEIDAIIKKLEDEVKSQKIVVGTKEYVLRLSRKIYDWGVKRLAFKGDCEVEPSDWEAMQNKCGLCTEKTAIMHYAFTKAGLKPEFLYVDEYSPTVKNFNIFSDGYFRQVEQVDPHVLIGIPIPGEGRSLRIDVLNRSFDGPMFRRAKTLTPRQFVTAMIINRAFDFKKKEDWPNFVRSVNVCLDVASNDFYCLFLKDFNYNSDEDFQGTITMSDFDERPNNGIVQDIVAIKSNFKSAVKINQQIFGDTIVSVDAENLYSALDKLTADLERVAKKDPKGTAKLATFSAVILAKLAGRADVLAAQNDSLRTYLAEVAVKFKEQALKLVVKSLEWNPDYLNAYLILDNLIFDNIIPNFGFVKEAYKAITKFSSDHPEIPLSHYLKAGYGLSLASGFSSAKASPILKDAKNALEKAEKLEPGNIGVAVLTAGQALYRKKPLEGIEVLRKIKVTKPGLLSFRYYYVLMFLHISLGNYKEAKNAVSGLIGLSPYSGLFLAKAMYSYLTNIHFGLKKGSGQVASKESSDPVSTVGDTGKIALLDLWEWMITKIAEIGVPSIVCKQLYGLVLINIIGVHKERSKGILNKLGQDIPPVAKSDMDRLMNRMTDFVMKFESTKLKRMGKKGEYDFDYVVSELKGILTPVKDHKGFTKFCILAAKVAILNGNMASAGVYYDTANAPSELFHEYVYIPMTLPLISGEKRLDAESMEDVVNLAKFIILRKGSRDSDQLVELFISNMKEIYKKADQKYKNGIKKLIDNLKTSGLKE